MNGEVKPKLIRHYVYLREPSPIISIVVPVFNQSQIIQANLASILKSTENFFELIIIDDGSTDTTTKEIKTFLDDLKDLAVSTKITEVSFYRFKRSVFETRCDDFGIRSATTNYVIEIQADMEVYEKGYDAKMLTALKSTEDILMISGRGTEPIEPIVAYYRNTLGSDRSVARSVSSHFFLRCLAQLKHRLKLTFKLRLHITQITKVAPTSFSQNKFEIFTEKMFYQVGKAGRLGTLIEVLPTDAELKARKIWLGQTVMRGPLIIDREKYLKVNGLNVRLFFQGFDDHELSVRSYQLFDFRVGYVPIGFSSPLADGSTRRARSISSELQILQNLLRIRRRWKESTLYLYADESAKKLPPPEIRNF